MMTLMLMLLAPTQAATVSGKVCVDFHPKFVDLASGDFWTTSALRPARGVSLVVIDEETIPADFWKPQPAKLDRQGLISSIPAGRVVPGALLGNVPMTISVRTK